MTDFALQELLDKQAIAELVMHYSRGVDRHDFALLRTLYAPDGVDDHGKLYSGGAEGYVDWLEGAMGAVETNHSIHQHLIAVQGESAEGEVYVTAFNRIPDGQGGHFEFIQGLRYIDRYRKSAGRWRFAHRTVVVDWARRRETMWDFSDPMMQGRKPGVSGADDPSYRLLGAPLFRRR